ncbi:hypothetical protein VaNZ11_000190 [Volvox africanus]|uniref:Protein kinase domain-containing protein n=1 Tax=Volvox africanus TaxID=51714 RepID=A0ABQ5RLX9_9CHLO|nr:hypothetical protein VaNZ11_000190 [Volvox africanus]
MDSSAVKPRRHPLREKHLGPVIIQLHFITLAALSLRDANAASATTITSERKVYNGLTFARAVADASISTLILMEDVVLQDGDWADIPMPLLLVRNLTVTSDPSELNNPRILNMNWVAEKIRLGNKVLLRLQSLVVLNYRLGNHNQAPGLDILSPCSPGTSAVVEVVDTVGVHRVCYPPRIQEMSLASVKRPASIPGNQSYHSYLAQSGCINDTSARPLERCWPHRGLYDDVAMLGADPKDYNLVQLNGYIVHLIRVVYLCELMVSEDCVANMTALGCATFTYATLNPPWRPLAQPRSPPTSQIEVAAAVVPAVQKRTAVEPLQPAAAERLGGLSTAQKGAITGSVVGGLGVMSLAVLLALLHRRRMRQAAGEELPSTLGSQWRGLALWECIRLSVPDSAAIRRHFGVVQIPASSVTSSTQSADAVEAGPAAEVTANASRAKGKAVLEAFSAGAASISLGSPFGPSQRQASDTGSTRETPTAAAIDGLGLAQGPQRAAAVIEATGAAPATAALATHGGCSVTDDGDGSSEATGVTRLGGARDSRPAGWMAIAAAAATMASGDSVRGVLVTPLTPHRPDVNLNLVPGRQQQQQQQQHHLPQQQQHSYEEEVNVKIREHFTTEQAAAHTVRDTGTEGAQPSAANTFTSPTMGPPCTAATAEVVLLPTVRGRGSFGRVVEGMYQGQKVAVKLMTEGLAPVSMSNERLLRSFTQEVEVLARCFHPNVIRLLAACVAPPSLCLVMELMDTSLEQLIQQAPGRLLPMSTVLRIAVDVARGLEYLHPTIVHRDLKPANVLVNDPLGPNQVAKLSDFGLARLHCSELMTTNPEAGTPAYMAPECFDVTVASITFHVDMYALGILLWVMLTGIQPWEGVNFMRLAFKVTYGGERPPLSAIPPDRRPHKLLRLLRSCWEADPRRRPAAAEAVKELMLVQQMMEVASLQNTTPLAPNLLQQPVQSVPSRQPQLRCMAVFGGLTSCAAPQAAGVGAAAAEHQQPYSPRDGHQHSQICEQWTLHEQRLCEQGLQGQRLHNQRLYEQVLLQLLAVGRVPRSLLLQRQSSFCSVHSRWQQQQLLLKAAGSHEAAWELCTEDFMQDCRKSHNGLQQQQQQRQKQHSCASAGRLVASLDSGWRTALSARLLEELGGSWAAAETGGTAVHLTIDTFG